MSAVEKDFDGRAGRKKFPGRSEQEILEAEYAVAGDKGLLN
jgi:hypothetical protein